MDTKHQEPMEKEKPDAYLSEKEKYLRDNSLEGMEE